ncbi:hypothetical protein GFS60_07377 (plasmid) [Rhodococcus sp. WAY2]|nr:hypothetical protein GFS60_07377 [Rhodococcus sp. WAY2]
MYEGGINGCVVGDVALDAVYTFRDGRATVRCAFPTCSVQLLAHMV